MWNHFWPLFLIVGSNTFYNICTKSLPENSNPYSGLIVTYFTAMIISVILFLFSSDRTELLSEIKSISFLSVILGLSVVGLEAGYIYLYRAGWQISIGSLVANIALAIILLFIGLLFYKEVISLKQILGIVLCILGLYLIN